MYANEILKDATLSARKVSIFNLTASFFDIVGALIYPLLVEGRGWYCCLPVYEKR